MTKTDPPNEETLEELRAKYGTILECEADGIHVVLAKPSKENVAGTYRRFREQMGNERTRVTAFEALFNATVVYPDRATVKTLLEEEPGLAFTFGKEAAELIGIRDTNVKKS